MLRRLLYHNFRSVYRIDQWFRHHFTKPGMLVFGAMIAAAVFGIDTRKTFAYQLFSFTAALLIVSWLASFWYRTRFSFKRQLPPFGSVNQALHYHIVLDNPHPRAQIGLSLQEALEGENISFQQYVQAVTPHVRRNWFDQYVGYPRWVWLLRHQRGADTRWQHLPALPAQHSLKIRTSIYPQRRGYVHFRRLFIARPDPLGLFNALQTLSQADAILILPQRYPVPLIDLPGSRRYQAGGVNLAMSVGDAVEFVALREYRPGDALRNIHWKSWARQGKPIVKEFQDEFFVRHALVLDTFCTAAQHAVFEEAVSVAASFVGHLTTQDTLLDLMFVGTEAFRFTGGRGLGHVEKMLEILACVELCSDKPFGTLASLLLEHGHELSGCIFVLLDWDTARQAVLEQLQQQGVPMLTLVVLPVEKVALKETLPKYCHGLRMGHIAEDLAGLKL